jgi:Protein of unknown function (DUF3149)
VALDVPQMPDRVSAIQCRIGSNQESAVLKDLFTTDVGLMTVIGLSFMMGMGVFFIRYFLKHMREDGEAAARQGKG